jgi:general secretion pathway protein A
VAASEEDLMVPLANSWSEQIDKAKANCASLPSAGLFCYRLRGGLREARDLDRPFLMKLKGEPAKWLLVREVDASHAKIRKGEQLVSVRLPVLEAAGAGEALSLWRMQPGFRSQLQSGMRGADVEWLATQLSRWSGLKRKPGEATMDVGLIAQVRQFQQLQGLDADGLVGPRTWMKLNAVAGVAEPRLQPLSPLASR